jgi:RNA polymerase sigma-70 factor (ECF subfamily)
MTNPEDFEEFMRNYQDMVFSTAVRMLGNETDAADIAQEVFLRAHDRFAELLRMQSPGAWLKKVATNLCLNQLTRYRFRWRFFSEMESEETGESFAGSLPAEDVTGQRLEETERNEMLEAALQKLPTPQRVPLVLYHFEDMSYEDIAKRLGVSLSKVKTDIHRGREALRLKIETARRDESAPRKVSESRIS